jgi:hypothetical protein
MGNTYSIWGKNKGRDEIEDTNRDQEKSVPIRLNCTYFSMFNVQWAFRSLDFIQREYLE